MRVRGRISIVFAALCCVLASVAYSASAAVAADTIYWGDGNGNVRLGNLDGTGSASTLFNPGSGVRGIAIDPAGGKIYADTGGGAPGNIVVANLDGTGATTLYASEDGPEQIAVDPAAGKIYWADFGSNMIRVANLNGTGSPSTLFSGESGADGLAIDPAAGKIYWTDSNTGLIRVGNLDGTGTPTTLFSGESTPFGLAINPVTGKIYWTTEVSSGAVRVGNLNGSGSASDLFSGEAFPWGLAIDPSANKIYWAAGASAIRVGNLDGTGSAADLFTGEAPDTHFPVLFRAPAGTGAPLVSGGSTPGSSLSCSQGSWDTFTAGGLYRAPASFAYQWMLNGMPIATTSSVTASQAGSYVCTVTATNQAGHSPQASAAHVVVAPTPVLSQLKISPPRFSVAGRRVDGKCVKQTAKNAGMPHCRLPVKVMITFTLNTAASVTLSVTEKLPGRKVGGHCVKPTTGNKGKRPCTRTKAVPGTIMLVGVSSGNSLSFAATIGGHTLGAGSYILTAVPAGGTPSSTPFQIVG